MVMKVSRNGQVSIPASARHRWNTDRVVVVDLGTRVVLRPVTDQPVATLRGKYAGGAVTTDEIRHRERAEDSARERRNK